MRKKNNDIYVVLEAPKPEFNRKKIATDIATAAATELLVAAVSGIGSAIIRKITAPRKPKNKTPSQLIA